MSETHEAPGPKSPSQQEFLRLFLASEREIMRYVCALVPSVRDAEEIVQEAAVLLWEKFDQYDPERPFTPWACRFAMNVTRQWMARRNRWKALLDNGLAEELAMRREALQPKFNAELVHLEHCLQKLPEKQRSIVEGYYFQRRDIEAVSEQAHKSVEAVYKILQRVRRQLRACIERALQEEATT